MKRYVTLAFRIALLVALFAFLTVLPAVAIGPAPPDWAPPVLTAWAFDVRLAMGTPAKAISSITQGSLKDKRVYFDTVGETVSFKGQGINLAGTLFRPAEANLQPAVLLLHGSSPEGRLLGLYRVLGREFADRGYFVLSIDQRGYGQSDDPPSVNSIQDFDYAGDVKYAVDYLASIEGVDSSRLYIVGHSFGGDVAITGGIAEPRLNKIVAIGPGRRFEDRAKAELAYFQRRDMRYMDLSQPIPENIFLQSRGLLPIDNHIDYFSTPDHKPILLIDGALESDQDRQFLQEIYETIAEPKGYITLATADHYANTANFGSMVIYDERAVTQLVEEIDAWLLTD